jgi:hypothetical protein
MLAGVTRLLHVRESYLPVSLSLLILLCGCSPSADDVRARHEGASVGTAAKAAKKPVSDARSRDAELVSAVALNKAGVPVEVRFRIETKPVLGEPVTIELVATPAETAQIRRMQWHLQPGSGLVLQGEAVLSDESAAPGVPLRHEIIVVPQAAGVLELEAQAAIDTNAESVSQTFSIPLVVQPGANTG